MQSVSVEVDGQCIQIINIHMPHQDIEAYKLNKVLEKAVT
ncbi:unnamed protein product, partial [Allacma fusca]